MADTRSAQEAERYEVRASFASYLKLTSLVFFFQFLLKFCFLQDNQEDNMSTGRYKPLYPAFLSWPMHSFQGLRLKTEIRKIDQYILFVSQKTIILLALTVLDIR